MVLENHEPINVLLDGKGSSSIRVWLEDDAGKRPTRNVNVTIKGYLKFENYTEEEKTNAEFSQWDASQKESLTELVDRNAIYPVLFVERDITLIDGEAIITLLPRSEDILEDVSTITESAGEGVSEGTPSSEIAEKGSALAIVIETDVIRFPYQISIQITVDDEEFFGQTIDGYQETSAEFNGFVPEALRQSPNPVIKFYSDIDWIPVVDPILNTNDSTQSEILATIRDLNNSVPFGASTVYDALIESASLLSDNDLDGIKKTIYLFTDNDSNLSVNNADDVIEEVTAIDGAKKTPIVIGNFAVVYPLTLSAKANITDTSDLNKIAFWTGGQSMTVTSADHLNDLVNIFYGEAAGALGYGTFEFVLDLGEEALIDTVTSFFDLTDNSNSSWHIDISSDGYIFTPINEVYQPNQVVTYSEVYARYIKFHIILVTGFGSEVIEGSNPSIANTSSLVVERPSLTQVRVVYNQSNTAYLYMNLIESIYGPQQIALAVDANNGDGVVASQIKVGVAKSNSHNWTDFSNMSQPLLDQNGKTFIPLRYTDSTDSTKRDRLDRIDKYSYKAGYGPWDPESTVVVYDSTGTALSSSDYKAYPRDGIVVFDRPTDDTYTMTVRNRNEFRIGLKMTNRSATHPLDVYGVGYFYNTNEDLLPPVEKLPPEALAVTVSPDDPNMYGTVTANYTYRDTNLDPEDISKTEIKWYINGIRISYLDNLTTWNNIEDFADPLWTHAFTFTLADIPFDQTTLQYARTKAESILKIGDKLYFTVKVSDGNLFGETVQSNIVEIQEMIPTVDALVVKAMDSTGAISDRLQGDRAALASYTFVSDTGVNNSQIVWYVNGVEFKRGNLGDEVATDATPVDRIHPGDINLDIGVVAILPDNEVYFQIIPKTGNFVGTTLESDSVIVQNALAVATNVKITPSSPSSNEDLVLNYDFFDFDIDALKVTDQTNSTRSEWYKTTVATPSTFVKQSFDNVGVIPSAATSVGEKWKVIVIPNDGLEDGESKTSNIVIIKETT